MVAFILRAVAAVMVFLAGINQLHASKHAIWWLIGLAFFIVSFCFEDLGPVIPWRTRRREVVQ